MYSLPFGKIFSHVCAYKSQVYLEACNNKNFAINFIYFIFFYRRFWRMLFAFYFMLILHTFVQVEFQYPVKEKEEVFLILTRL